MHNQYNWCKIICYWLDRPLSKWIKHKQKKVANQASSKLWCVSYTGYVLAKEIVSLLSLQLLYSDLNELTLYAGVLYTQPSLHSFSSWPHSDVTSLGHSVTCALLASSFSTAEMFWDSISILLRTIHVGFPATQNMCDR